MQAGDIDPGYRGFVLNKGTFFGAGYFLFFPLLFIIVKQGDPGRLTSPLTDMNRGPWRKAGFLGSFFGRSGHRVLLVLLLNPHRRLRRAPRNLKIILRIQGAKGSRIQVKGMEIKALEPSNPGILGPYYH
jgi:hypothetical protein